MKPIPTPLVLVASLALSLPADAAESAESAESADAAWQKIAEVIKGPAQRPKTREEATKIFKEWLEAADAQAKRFADEHPSDPRRWQLRLFDARMEYTRRAVGLPAKPGAATALDEILKSSDADPATKTEASSTKIMKSAQEVEGGSLPLDAWTAMANAHLAAHPDDKRGATIRRKVEELKGLAELKAKPLDIKFTALDGREVDLSKMRGKVVLIDFWAVWCGPCVAELPNVLKAYEKLHPKGFEIIGISLDSDRAKLETFLKEKNMTWPQYFDGKSWKNEISSRCGIHSIPAMWLVDKKGFLASTNVRGRLEEEVGLRLAE